MITLLMLYLWFRLGFLKSRISQMLLWLKILIIIKINSSFTLLFLSRLNNLRLIAVFSTFVYLWLYFATFRFFHFSWILYYYFLFIIFIIFKLFLLFHKIIVMLFIIAWFLLILILFQRIVFDRVLLFTTSLTIS